MNEDQMNLILTIVQDTLNDYLAEWLALDILEDVKTGLDGNMELFEEMGKVKKGA